MPTSQADITVICSRHRKRCGLTEGTRLRVAHADGKYCDSQLFEVTERRQVNPETAQAVLIREQRKAAMANGDEQ